MINYGALIYIKKFTEKGRKTMKYDLLEPLKTYLSECYCPNTAASYYAAVVKLFSDKQFDSLSEIEPAYIEARLKEQFGKHQFSSAKNGLLRLKELYPELQLPADDYFTQTSRGKRNRSKRPRKDICLDTVCRKINQLHNPKLKLAYRLAMVSGLRSCELEALEASDLTFQNEKLFITVRNGKGGSNGIVECLDDPYLLSKLPPYLAAHPAGTLFYSAKYMQEQAHKLGIECHDLRRIFAIQCRKKLLNEHIPVEQANARVQQELRHARFSTTKRYLFNRKLTIRSKKEVKNE